MSDLEVIVEYKNKPQRVGLIVMGVLMPMWAIVIPFVLGLFVSLFIQHPGQVPPLISMIVLSALIAIPVISVVAAAFFEDDRLLVSKEGFVFPLIFLPQLKLKCFKRAELDGIRIEILV